MQTLEAPAGFFSQLVPVVVRLFGEAFPELRNKEAMVTSVIAEEELAFSSSLERGVKVFGEVVAAVQAVGGTQIDGERAFYLYDTLGFPLDLTELMAKEKGLQVCVGPMLISLSAVGRL